MTYRSHNRDPFCSTGHGLRDTAENWQRAKFSKHPLGFLERTVESQIELRFALPRTVSEIQPKIRKYLDKASCERLVTGLVASKMDYCNGVLYGLPKTLLGTLQHLQNAAARIVTRTSKFQHISPVMFKLHWLPVEHRIKYKVILTVFKSLHQLAPAYISSMIQVNKPTRASRSTTHRASRLLVPRTRTKHYGDRALSVCGPTLWNTLPPDLTETTQIGPFKRKLKTLLFCEAYSHL